ncbi:glucose transporter type 1 [Caerostris extrusa]|uniref:Glucose transporter type 1 n=1 Tax=Caerostris extrusa TaxID=172846 RepID=A0AAV4M7G8_CAEEX|nr:glucose transporter type 1 [Caerostris extrusa]
MNCGINTALVPMYLSEISPLTLRGGLGTVNQLGITIGLLLSQVLGISVIPAVLQLMILPLCPESPRYLLISKQEESLAREALQKLRCSSLVEEDIEEMKAEDRAQQHEPEILHLPLVIGVVMQLTQQLSGINAFLYSWLAYFSVASTLFFVVFYAMGPGPIPWMITAELFSQGPRSAAMSITVTVNWFANFVVGLIFPIMQLDFGHLLTKIPETKNKTFEEISALFRSNEDMVNINGMDVLRNSLQPADLLYEENKPVNQCVSQNEQKVDDLGKWTRNSSSVMSASAQCSVYRSPPSTLHTEVIGVWSGKNVLKRIHYESIGLKHRRLFNNKKQM